MSKMLGLPALLVAVYAAALASATTVTVGDDQGWTTGVDYVGWIKGKTFAVGDKLVFNYPSEEHTVAEVRKDDYFACAGGNALSNDRSGCTNVTLTAPGTRYFICGIPGHCTIGMRIAVTVVAPPSTPPSAGGVTSSSAAGTYCWVASVPAIGSVVAAALIKLTLISLS